MTAIRFFRFAARAAYPALALVLSLALPRAARADDFDGDWDRPRKEGGGELLFGFSGNSFSSGTTTCSYYYNSCATSQKFDLKSVSAPRLSLHFFPLRHFQIGVDFDHVEPRATIFADVYDPTTRTYYTQETDLGKLKLTRAGVSAFYRAPMRNLDFYLGGGLEVPLEKKFSTAAAWRCQDGPACLKSDEVTADVSTGYRLAIGVDIKLSRDVWFNIEGIGKSYDTEFTFHSVGPAPTGNNNLKYSDRVTEGVLTFGIGLRF